ncbi:MAG TPA: Uma2 family endonuclease [Chloroflexota bacterium]|jgi:Uma2 family endonuclease
MANVRTIPAPPLVPWAEVVPNIGRATVDDMLALADDGWRYEVVEGVLVRMAGSGAEATTIGQTIAFALNVHVRPRRLGVVTGADGVYKFPGAETGLLPDVGFCTATRWAIITDRTKPIPFAPDLAVEVVSPGQTAAAMAAKARHYLGGGTRLVWVVWPQRGEIDIWRMGSAGQPSATLNDRDVLEGESVVPGFSFPVSDVFDDPLG